RAAREEGASAAAAPARGERAFGARELPSEPRRALRRARDLRAASPGRPGLAPAPHRGANRHEPRLRVSLERARGLLPRRAAHPRDPAARLVLPHAGALLGLGARRSPRAAAAPLSQSDDRRDRLVPAGAPRRPAAAVGRTRVLGALRGGAVHPWLL